METKLFIYIVLISCCTTEVKHTCNILLWYLHIILQGTPVKNGSHQVQSCHCLKQASNETLHSHSLTPITVRGGKQLEEQKAKTPIYRTLKKNLCVVLLQLTVYGQKSVKFLALSSLTFERLLLKSKVKLQF